jgi:hypothetical protein
MVLVGAKLEAKPALVVLVLDPAVKGFSDAIRQIL